MLCFMFKIDQDFMILFGEEVSGRFLAKLPPTSKGKKSSKISASDAAGRLVKFMKVCC